ncbi:MAG: T9SS type A sorting domain-containing protein, partial [Saprospiraceae bacterium]|nr:T9SS type A sorting domain-containing protein [Saprospiraceae bacterium]
LPNVPTGQSLNLVAVDNQGVLWFSGYDGSSRKVHEFDGQTWKTYETEIYPMAGNFIFDVAFDCDNNIWFGGRDVLTKFDGLSWENFTYQDIGLSGPNFEIWSLAVDTNTCDLWISFSNASTASVSFAKYDGNTFTIYSTPGGWEVYETTIAKDGTLWVASGRSGLGKFDGNVWTWFNEQNSPVSDDVHNVTLDYEQNVWINTGFPSAVMRWDGSNWLKFDFTNSPITYSDWLLVDHESKIWTNGGNSLLRFNGVQWQEFPVPSTGFDDVYSMVQDQEHNYWLSNSQGVHKFDGSTFESYNFIDHPISDNLVSRVRVDPYENKWFMHNGGSGVTVFNENGISNQVISLLAAVRGKVFFDANQNGQHEQGNTEPGIPNEKVLLLPNNTTVFTNFDGNYTLFPTPGNYQLNYSGSDIYTPTTAANLPLIVGTNEISGLDFGAWAENAPDSISLDMSVGSMRCDYETNVWLTVRNYGLLEATGEVTLLYDTALTFLHADPPPDVIQDSLLTWHYSGLSLFELQQIKVVFLVPGADALGQIISLQSNATVIEGGIVMAADEQDEWAEVHCSYDPNDKASASVGPSVDEYSLLNDALDFTIRFQNSGNDTAFTVILRDTLDPNLDFSTLQIVSSSHTMRTTLTADGVLSFVFDNIDLLWESIDYAGSQGFVKYCIAPKGNLPNSTSVLNTAHIYFDFNPAIVTNTTLNILVETLPFSGAADIADHDLAARVYPNPNSGDFLVEWFDDTPAQPWQINIIDLLGRSCFQSSFDQNTTQIRDLSPGFFFVFLEKGGRMECHKLVVTKD